MLVYQRVLNNIEHREGPPSCFFPAFFLLQQPHLQKLHLQQPYTSYFDLVLACSEMSHNPTHGQWFFRHIIQFVLVESHIPYRMPNKLNIVEYRIRNIKLLPAKNPYLVHQ